MLKPQPFANAVALTVVITGWITGYIWAALYNHFSK